MSTEQNKFNQTINWNLREAQWWYQGDAADYIVGSQPTFWRREQEGDYWGVTTIRRWGFQPQQKSFGAFNPNQRFQPNQVERTITGEAPPNTLARLLSRFDDRIIDEVLVDESGIYTFENIPTKGENYRVLLYPDGLLINEPIIEDIKFTDVPQLLPKGASVLTLSTGFRRKREGQEFIGELKNFGGGVAYRLGVLEDITLGVGLYNEGEAFRSLGEIFYQPAKIPLRVSVSALSPGSDSPWELLSRINFNPSPNFSLSLNGDRFGQRAQMNWRLSQNFSLIASGQNDNSDYSWATGIRFSRSGRFASTFGRVEIDNKNNLLLSVIQRFGSLRLEHRQNKDSSESEISYNFSGKRFFDEGHSLVFDYDTKNNSNRNDNLGIIRWRYRSERKLRDGFPLWEFNLGYGSGSRGSGVIASIATAAIPGGILRLTYQQVSLSSDNSQFRLDFFPRLNIQNGIRSGPNLRDFDLLRSEGGLWIKPFYDYNNNGIIDGPDEIFTEDANLMLVLNNKAIDRSRPEIKKDGVFITVPQGIYRLDLDRAGFPFDWSSNISALAVKVVPGSYTEVLIPFSLSYTFTGVVTNAEGKPINGAKIEAKPIGEGETIFSITNPGGVYYLEGLKQGIYNLTINGKPAQPNQLIINQSSEPFQELNLR